MVSYSRTPGHRLRLGEVTVTEMNLYLLRNFWTKGVYIDTNEPVEKTTGADWEWLIGHGNKWVQIRVQAKIVNRQGDFAGLGHPNGTQQQMDRLIAPVGGTVTCRWMPLYVFYTSQPAFPLSPPFIGPPVLGMDATHSMLNTFATSTDTIPSTLFRPSPNARRVLISREVLRGHRYSTGL